MPNLYPLQDSETVPLLHNVADLVHQTGIKLHPSVPLTEVIANKPTTPSDESD